LRSSSADICSVFLSRILSYLPANSGLFGINPDPPDSRYLSVVPIYLGLIEACTSLLLTMIKRKITGTRGNGLEGKSLRERRRHFRRIRAEKSRLRSMEHVKEYSHAEATKRINKGRQHRHHRNQSAQGVQEVEGERPHEKSRHQNGSDQCQQHSIFQCHDGSMNITPVIRNSAYTVGLRSALRSDGNEGETQSPQKISGLPDGVERRRSFSRGFGR